MCSRKTFAEAPSDLAGRYARKTVRLTDILKQLGFALGGEQGARIASVLKISCSADTFLRLIRKTPLAAHSTPTHLGVDDWAFHRNVSYGTIQQGGTILGIARQLQIGAQTVRKFVHSPQFPEWAKPAVTRSAIDLYRIYLEERWRQGCQDAGPLRRELQARGFTGSWMMVYRWIQVRRDEPASASTLEHKQVNRTPRRLAPRHLAWLDLA